MEPATDFVADQEPGHRVTGPRIYKAVKWGMVSLLLVLLVVILWDGVAINRIHSAGGRVGLSRKPAPFLSWAGEAGRLPLIVPYSSVNLQDCLLDDRTWQAVLHIAGPELKVALLDETGLTDRQLAELTQQSPGLYSLSARNSRLTDQGLASLAKCPNLQCLSIGSPHLSPDWPTRLPPLPLLKQLNLGDLEWNQATAAALSRFKNIRWLILTRVTFPEQLSDGYQPGSGSTIEKLTIQECSLTEAGLQLIVLCEQLRWLRCDDVTFPAAGCHHLASLQQLHYIFLYDCKVNALCLQALSTLPEVDQLQLRGSTIEDSSLQHLADFPKLQTLDLSNTSVSDAAIPHLVLNPAYPDRAGIVEFEESSLISIGFAY